MTEIDLDSQSIIFVSTRQNSVTPYKMGHLRKMNIEKYYREKEIENVRHVEKINEIINVRLYN